MKFSLIMGTAGRIEEVRRFLAFLDAQTYRNFELIVVDQNDDDRLTPMLEDYRGEFEIIHLHSRRGLSRARNAGLKMISGDIVSFPDDDCWYPPDLLQRIASMLDVRPELDGVTGRFTDRDGRSEGRWLEASAPLTRYNVWRGAISFSIFLRRPVVDSVGAFNETLGLGSGTPWGAAEETDYLLRCMRKGFRLHYFTDLVLHHPLKSVQFDAAARNRQKGYEAGIGHVIRINDYPRWYFPLICLRTCAGVCAALIRGRVAQAHFKYVSILARIGGWRGSLE